MQLLPSLCLSATLVALPCHTVASGPTDDVRGLRIERDLDGGAWLPAGSVGGRPLDALTPGWPWYRLVVSADLGEESQAELIGDLVDAADALERRVALLVVDLGDRDVEELDWLLWSRGWHRAPVAFTTELGEPHAPLEPGWRLSTGEPSVGGRPIAPGAQRTFEGELERSKAVLAAVAEALAEDVVRFSASFGRETTELARDLDLDELASRERKFDGSSGELDWGAGSLLLVMQHLRGQFVHLAAEAELALRMGQPLDAAAALERVERVFGDDSRVAQLAVELEGLGLDKAALKAGKELEKLIGDDVGSRPERTLARLEKFLARDRPDFVAARARHYARLLERFAPLRAADEDRDSAGAR